MTIADHPSFDRPAVSVRLWRYTDLPKFIDLLTTGRLWLTNAEVLAKDDPYEGFPGTIRFPHRMWKSIDEVPEYLRNQILTLGSRSSETPQNAFRLWFMTEEQRCTMQQYGRRNYFLNCWHAAHHESIAMWKIYTSPGAGVGIISNGARLEAALSANAEEFHLGTVKYQAPSVFKIGGANAFDTIMVKRSHFEYEREVRLVYWQSGDFHDALEKFDWNEETMRFDNIVEDLRPIVPGLSFACDVDTLIETLLVSPFAPAWYVPMIEKVRDQFGHRFTVRRSTLIEGPPLLP